MNAEQKLRLDPNALEAAKQSANVEHFPERSLIVEVAIRSYLAAHEQAFAEQRFDGKVEVPSYTSNGTASHPAVAKGGVTEAIAAVERERRRHFCSGDDCEPYDHGRDEGFDLALKALRSLPAALAVGDEGIREGRNHG